MPFSARTCELNFLKESTWDPRYLKAKCKELGLEGEYNAYTMRLLRSYISVFFVFHTSVSLIHCLLIATLSEHMQYIYFDVGISIVSCLIPILILSINFSKKTKRHSWLMLVTSALACLTLMCADLTLSLYHHFFHGWDCGTFYNTYIIFMIYTFLPILHLHAAIVLGLFVSTVYLTYFVNFVYPASTVVAAMFIDISLYLCINVVGIFFRVVNDMIVRSSFIDRHQFIKEELSLRDAQHHEKLLLDSILPAQFSGLLQKDITKRILQSQKTASTGNRDLNIFRTTMAIQLHSDVSILYADVVNYTHLTTTLTVEKLVTTLHDLYARFDLAAQLYSVQRIKFLGDCYYCVAGLADADPDHANNAVALGIAMIAHIQEVRESQGLDINMRIGIHSGSLYAGVIGEAKLQFDVWGPDVTIANVLESTGVPGCVHISDAVLRNLEISGEYRIESGPEKAKNDLFLQKHKISTHLIVPRTHDASGVGTDSPDLFTFTNLSKTASHLPKTFSDVFDEKLREEYRKMPVIQFDPWSFCPFWRQKNTKYLLNSQMDCCLTFYDPDLEKPYLRQNDYLSKYYMLLAWIVGAGEIYIQLIDASTIYSWFIVVDCCVALSLTIMLFLAWYKHFFWLIYDRRNKPHTYGCFSCFIFSIQEKVQESMTLRVCTYLFVIILHWALIGMNTMSCRHADFILQYIEERIFHYEANSTTCFDPWVTTSMLALMICMAFTFHHIPFLLKIAVACATVIVYFIFIFFQFDFVFHHSTTTNPYFPAEFAHALIVAITFVTMFLKAKQTEFCKKVNFSWSVELEKKRNDAVITNRSITILLNNILPSHVVDIYLNSLANDQLYYENYKMVSVMFAMLSNFQMNLSSLRILNEVITQFDELLCFYKKNYLVEKIKIANYTYIAACGLDVNFAGSTSKPLRPGTLDEEKRLQLVNIEDRDEVVFVMASYALDLMRTLASCNNAYNGIIKEHDIIDGRITIGISSGEVMAGIVGAMKPHYDIWGDPVNMAARMETTGLPGRIQVTEESAIILQAFGIQSNYRGQTFVKGRGLLPTYFLGIDEDYNFIQVEGTRKSVSEGVTAI